MKNHPKILMCITLNIKYLVKLLCVLFFKKTNRFIEDYKGRQYLKLIQIQGKDKDVLKQYKETFDKIKYFIKKI